MRIQVITQTKKLENFKNSQATIFAIIGQTEMEWSLFNICNKW